MSQTVQLALPLEGRINTETTRALNGTQRLVLQSGCTEFHGPDETGGMVQVDYEQMHYNRRHQ
jgi:hypothetical protein